MHHLSHVEHGLCCEACQQSPKFSFVFLVLLIYLALGGCLVYGFLLIPYRPGASFGSFHAERPLVGQSNTEGSLLVPRDTRGVPDEASGGSLSHLPHASASVLYIQLGLLICPCFTSVTIVFKSFVPAFLCGFTALQLFIMPPKQAKTIDTHEFGNKSIDKTEEVR